jgi:hypothetical protein
MNTSSLIKVDAAGRSIAAGVSATIETGTSLKPQWHMWAALGLGLLVSLFVTPGVSLFAVVAIVAVAVIPEAILGHDETGAKMRLGATAALVAFTVLTGGLLGHWPVYVVLAAVWIGAANWQKPKPPADSGE